MGAAVGLPAASLCINRRLYQIANVQAVTIGRAEVSLQRSPSSVRKPHPLAQKSRAILIDTLICVLFPLIYVTLRTFLSNSLTCAI